MNEEESEQVIKCINRSCVYNTDGRLGVDCPCAPLCSGYKNGGTLVMKQINIDCPFCKNKGCCKIEDIYHARKAPPMFGVLCYSCGKSGPEKGTKKAALRAWKKAASGRGKK